MVSGCCDGIFIRRCAEFLLSCQVSQVQHFQWTDNSAARQLVARQGVGKIRHLSGKILWIQDAVLAGEVQMGQVPTMVTFSDIETKSLTRSRLYFLLHEIGAVDPETLEQVGQEEHSMVMDQIQAKNMLAKLVRMSVWFWGHRALSQWPQIPLQIQWTLGYALLHPWIRLRIR